jgi:hypothetical protein
MRLRPTSKRLLRERGYIYAAQAVQVDLKTEMEKLRRWQEMNK